MMPDLEAIPLRLLVIGWLIGGGLCMVAAALLAEAMQWKKEGPPALLPCLLFWPVLLPWLVVTLIVGLLVRRRGGKT